MFEPNCTNLYNTLTTLNIALFALLYSTTRSPVLSSMVIILSLTVQFSQADAHQNGSHQRPVFCATRLEFETAHKPIPPALHARALGAHSSAQPPSAFGQTCHRHVCYSFTPFAQGRLKRIGLKIFSHAFTQGRLNRTRLSAQISEEFAKRTTAPLCKGGSAVGGGGLVLSNK